MFVWKWFSTVFYIKSNHADDVIWTLNQGYLIKTKNKLSGNTQITVKWAEIHRNFKPLVLLWFKNHQIESYTHKIKSMSLFKEGEPRNDVRQNQDKVRTFAIDIYGIV